jgi:hypothetical protein
MMDLHPSARALSTSAAFQVARWRHNADWWSGKIVPNVVDVERAWHAVEQVRYWTERLAIC